MRKAAILDWKFQVAIVSFGNSKLAFQFQGVFLTFQDTRNCLTSELSWDTPEYKLYIFSIDLLA